MTNPNRQFVVVQLGSRQGYAVPALLQQSGLLDCLHTDLTADHWLARLALHWPRSWRPRALDRLANRTVPQVPPERIHCYPLFAINYTIARRGLTAGGPLARFFARSNAAFGRRVVQQGVGSGNAVFAYNGAALEVFRWARQNGWRTVLEQINAPESVYQRLMAQERLDWPDWEQDATAPGDWEPLAAREREEWQLADQILCGSEFVCEGIAADGGPAHRCQIVPYSAADTFYREPVARATRGPLRILFVGQVSLRKGIPYLLQAARMLHSPALTIRLVGDHAVSRSALTQLRKVSELLGPLPRTAIAEQFAWADVFVLPSICEGSAVVIYEALASGLPVITTHHAGSVVRDGLDGFVVPIRDPHALADRIDRLAGDSSMRAELAANARRRAQEYTRDRYAQRLLEAIEP